MSDLYLTESELEKLTGAKQYLKQSDVLHKMKIPYQINRKKEVIVVRAWLERAPFEGKSASIGHIQAEQPSIGNFGGRG